MRRKCLSGKSLFLLAGIFLAGVLAAGEDDNVRNVTTPVINTAATGLANGSFKPAQRGITLPSNPRVLVIPIDDATTTKYGMIDDWQADFVERRLRRAKDEKFDLVILEINTNGGSVASCEQINKAIQNCGVPVVAFVNEKAFSGGAIISLGTKAIIMSPQSQIGGAKAVSLFGELPADMKQKADAMMRAMVTNLADANNYPDALAKGMVDSDVEVYEVTGHKQRFITDVELEDLERTGAKPNIVHRWKNKNSIMSLSAKEAVNAGLASGIAETIDEVLVGLSATPATVEVAQITAAETAARFMSHPLWRVLAVLVGLIALFLEMKSPGHGVGYIAFAFCMGLFFWLQIFSHNAGLVELALFGLGAVMVAVELFLIPGFGFVGFSGFAMILASIVLSFLPESVSLPNLWKGGSSISDFEMARMVDGLKWAALTVAICVGMVVTALLKGATLPVISRMALQAQVEGSVHNTGGAPAVPQLTAKEAGPLIEAMALQGQSALTETVLRPAGKVRLAGATYDAITEGGFLDAGVPVIVLRVQGKSLVVRPQA